LTLAARRHRGSRHAILFVALLAALVAPGCAAPVSSPHIGTPVITNQQASITVPALWAGRTSDGNPVGGVEPAEIVVSTSSEERTYRVNLANIEAKGAGPAWRAATSMASAFATLFVGADPATVTYDFTVTGPIDGPSAGGVLTVGIIAAFRGQSLAPNTTMTGTITADGTIGPVGGVLTKIESAAREGYTTVVLPRALDPDGWATGNEFTALAKSLDVTLIPVDTISDAYAAMTGGVIEDVKLLAGTPLPEPIAEAARGVTESIVRRLATETHDLAKSVDGPSIAFALSTLDGARTDMAAGRWSRAYGTSVFALIRLHRARGATEVEQALRTSDLNTVKKDVGLSATEALAQARAAIVRGGQTPVRGLTQSFALPTALAWASFAEATLAGLLAELPNANSSETLIEMGRSIEESRLGLDVMLPDAITVLSAIATQPGSTSAVVAAQLDEYSDFLIQAGQSAETYLADVLGARLEMNGQFQNGGYIAGAVAAREILDARPKVEPGAALSYPQEASRFSMALTYYWLVSHAMASVQAYRVFPSDGVDEVDALLQGTMNAAIDDTWSFITSASSQARGSGVDLGSAQWSADWGREQALASRDTKFATESGWIAQGELWFDAVQVSAVGAVLKPARIGSAP